MVAYNKHNQMVEDTYEGVHDFANDQLVAYLTAAANAPVAGNSVLADLTEINYANLSSRNITTSSSSQTGGTYTLVLADLVLTASGAVATFRYAGMYNDTPAVPLDPLVSWWDYGSDVSLQNGETFTYDFNAVSGVLQHA